MSAMRILLLYATRRTRTCEMPRRWPETIRCAWPILHYMQYCTSRAGIRQWRATNVGLAARPLQGARAGVLLRVPGANQTVRQRTNPEWREQQQDHQPTIPALQS